MKKTNNPFQDYPLYTFVKYDSIFDRYYYKSPSAKTDWDLSFPSTRLQQQIELGLPAPNSYRGDHERETN